MGVMQNVRAEKGKALVDRGLGHVWSILWHVGIVISFIKIITENEITSQTFLKTVFKSSFQINF